MVNMPQHWLPKGKCIIIFVIAFVIYHCCFRRYRVARVEQTETPEMLKERNKTCKKGTSSKVVSRELCSVMTKGTRTYCHLDDMTDLENMSSGISASLLMCILERNLPASDDESAVVEYGVCFVDTVLSTVTLAQFEDDNLRYRLRTLLSRHQPTEVLLNKLNNSQETVGVVQLMATGAVINYSASTHVPTPHNVVDDFRNQYFQAPQSLPRIIEAACACIEEGSSDLMMSSLGVIVSFLKRGLIDHDILTLGKIFCYIPPDDAKESFGNVSGQSRVQLHDSSEADTSQEHMVLDSVTLANLEIFKNNFDRSEKGSLWAFMNRCKTSFGTRLLRDWICKPLMRIEDITCRSTAVANLLNDFELVEQARLLLKSCPDLERLLGRVHCNGLKRKDFDHPDSRSVMYENQTYNSRKIKDFTDILRGESESTHLSLMTLLDQD
jgi:DNA mismatch repair protein MSH6